MSKQTKVIIVTREDEYSEKHTLYFDAIKRSSSLAKTNKLKSFFAASMLFKDMTDKNFDEKLIPLFKELDNNAYESLPNAYKIGIQTVLENSGSLNEEAKNKYDAYLSAFDGVNLYALLELESYSILLLLWNRVEEVLQGLPVKILAMEPFVKCVWEDFSVLCPKNDSVEYEEKGLLFIHDKQFYGPLQDYRDEVILDEKGLHPDSDCPKEVGTVLETYFRYVAAFGHAAAGGIFLNRILKFKFGEPTESDKISSAEDEAVSFASLRENAEKILVNAREEMGKKQ